MNGPDFFTMDPEVLYNVCPGQVVSQTLGPQYLVLKHAYKVEWTLPCPQSGIELWTCSIVVRRADRLASKILSKKNKGLEIFAKMIQLLLLLRHKLSKTNSKARTVNTFPSIYSSSHVWSLGSHTHLIKRTPPRNLLTSVPKVPLTPPDRERLNIHLFISSWFYPSIKGRVQNLPLHHIITVLRPDA